MVNNTQNSMGNSNSTWRCPVCETINGGDLCYVCKAPKPQQEEKKVCPRCGHKNNKDAKFCSQCRRRLGVTILDNLLEFINNNWKKIMVGAVLLGVLAVFMFKPHEHDWVEATCTTPKTCKSCGETTGTVAAHQWKSATCISAKTCIVCGDTSGSAKGHQWKAATCTSSKTCIVCGDTSGSAKGHQWKAATCDAPKSCEICNLTSGTKLGHKWVEATYDAPRTCSVCGKTSGTPKPKPPEPKDYLSNISDYWAEAKVDGQDTWIKVLEKELVQCRKMTVYLTVNMNYGAKCKQWNLWGRVDGKFKKIGKISLPNGTGDVSETIVLESPITLDAISVTPTAYGGYSWSYNYHITEAWING